MTTIYNGTTVRLSASFASFDGLNLDPSTVEVRVKPPGAALISSTYPAGDWRHPETGVYAFDVQLTDPGVWQFSFQGSGSASAYNESTFTVVNPSF